MTSSTYAPSRAPREFPRRVLLTVTGLSPQIVTETLYALAVVGEPAFIPTEVHLVTTAEGAERARLTLLSDDPGWFRRLGEDYRLADIAFDDDHIHVLCGPEGRSLDDIRTGADNEAAADALTECVREFTSGADTALHVSMAGGRKTMGFYAGYALSLYGRPQDRLSHVLVSAPFESHPEFYYPTPRSHVLYTPPPASRPHDTRDATVTLAEIPFVRLRHGLPESLLAGASRFSDAVAVAQRALGPPSLTIDPTARVIECAGERIELPPVDQAFLSWFARRTLADRPPLCRTDISTRDKDEYLAEHAAVHGEFSGEVERVRSALADGMEQEYFDQRRSHLHQKLDAVLGKRQAYDYHIHSDDGRPRSRYALALDPGQIRFEDLR